MNKMIIEMKTCGPCLQTETKKTKTDISKKKQVQILVCMFNNLRHYNKDNSLMMVRVFGESKRYFCFITLYILKYYYLIHNLIF